MGGAKLMLALIKKFQPLELKNDELKRSNQLCTDIWLLNKHLTDLRERGYAIMNTKEAFSRTETKHQLPWIKNDKASKQKEEMKDIEIVDQIGGSLMTTIMV